MFDRFRPNSTGVRPLSANFDPDSENVREFERSGPDLGKLGLHSPKMHVPSSGTLTEQCNVDPSPTRGTWKRFDGPPLPISVQRQTPALRSFVAPRLSCRQATKYSNSDPPRTGPSRPGAAKLLENPTSITPKSVREISPHIGPKWPSYGRPGPNSARPKVGRPVCDNYFTNAPVGDLRDAFE